MSVELIQAPTLLPSTARYKTSPRPKASFNTFLDAHRLFDPARPGTSTVRVERIEHEGHPAVRVHAEHPFKDGVITESLVCTERQGRLSSACLERSVTDAQGVEKRREFVDFRSPLPLPPDSYPEVMLPFLLRWQPFDGKQRALYAWINDRFVARVYYQHVGEATLDLPIGQRKAVEFMMYPDLNDWVNLGSVLSRLARPLVPKYRMWFDPSPPFHVLRFEGPYGPPGAPEIVLELESI